MDRRVSYSTIAEAPSRGRQSQPRIGWGCCLGLVLLPRAEISQSVERRLLHRLCLSPPKG
eukprot:4703034-Amphidinium_carterae.1